jgi:pectinesterase
VQIVRDIVYAEYGERRLKLDVYLPQESRQVGGAPGLLVVRGGSWRSGDKEDYGYIAGQLAKEGFVAASIEYRTSAEAKFPAAVHDVKAAVRWMRAHAATYNVNPNAIGAIGGSSGGHLVAMLATSGGVKNLEGAGGNSETSSHVQAVVAMACVCHMQGSPAVSEFLGAPPEAYADAINAARPTTYVTSRSAPLLLLHSQTDPVVPFVQSVEIERLYQRAGAVVALKAIEAPNIHTFWYQARYFPETIGQAVDFLRRNLKQVR